MYYNLVSVFMVSCSVLIMQSLVFFTVQQLLEAQTQIISFPFYLLTCFKFVNNK